MLIESYVVLFMLLLQGTDFMLQLSAWLSEWAAGIVGRDSRFRNTTFIISDASEPGEGEHKVGRVPCMVHVYCSILHMCTVQFNKLYHKRQHFLYGTQLQDSEHIMSSEG